MVGRAGHPARLCSFRSNHLATNQSPRNRGVNVGITFDLSQFTERVFRAVGASGQFNGPGPCSVQWVSSSSTATERFAIDHLANELFSKYDDGVPSPEKRSTAIQRFIDGEVLCSLSNCKFGPLPSGQPPFWLQEEHLGPSDPLRLDCEVFSLARKHISRVLGAFPGWDAVLRCADFGPGSTTRLSRRRSHRSNKWAGRPHATLFLQSPLKVLFDRYPLLWSRLEEPGAEICAGNKLDWVPKNYKTDRTIAVEPDWNMFFQKGLGGLLRRRLKRVGQDIDDQSTNRFLAAVGSITGELATLDMSMASDTVSYRLVEYLIRPDWFEALEQCRAPVGFYEDDGNEIAVIFEKFSSMGNGYTFELETLIFWGILRAVSDLTEETDHRLYAYGDDLVVPSRMANVAMEYLAKAGFVVNPSKSFWTGPFRESCGGHYFKGDDVTPFYVREPVDSLDRLFLLHNNLYRWFNRLPGICSPDSVKSVLNWIRSHAPEKWQRPRLLSEDVGDGAFIGSFDEVCPSPIGKTTSYRGWEGWRAETLQFRPRRPQTFYQKPPQNQGKEASRFKPWVKRVRAPFDEGTGPDLASLWSMECREANHPWLGVEQPDFWLSAMRSKDRIEGTFGLKTAETDIPHAERYWYVGVQVLPWNPGSSWFAV